MFAWFRRREAPPAPKKKMRPSAPRSTAVELAPADSGPLPEVVAEGNTQADWSAWEDSMTALDSQMQDLAPSERVRVRDTRPSQPDELDPFSRMDRKN